jgi:hypothetical protein
MSASHASGPWFDEHYQWLNTLAYAINISTDILITASLTYYFRRTRERTITP